MTNLKIRSILATVWSRESCNRFAIFFFSFFGIILFLVLNTVVVGTCLKSCSNCYQSCLDAPFSSYLEVTENHLGKDWCNFHHLHHYHSYLVDLAYDTRPPANILTMTSTIIFRRPLLSTSTICSPNTHELIAACARCLAS